MKRSVTEMEQDPAVLSPPCLQAAFCLRIRLIREVRKFRTQEDSQRDQIIIVLIKHSQVLLKGCR